MNGNVVFEFLQEAIAVLGPQVTAIIALIVCDVLLAVAAAIKTKQFQLAQLADFFSSQVFPKLIGWAAFAVVVKFVLPDYLPALGPVDIGALADVAFGAVVLSLAGSILAHAQTIGIIPKAADGALRKVGIGQ